MKCIFSLKDTCFLRKNRCINRFHMKSYAKDEAVRRAVYACMFFSSLHSVMSCRLSSMQSVDHVDQSELSARWVRGEAATCNWLRCFFPKGRIFQAILTEYLASSKEH